MQPREAVCLDDLKELIHKHHDLAVPKNNQRSWFARAFFDLPIFASIQRMESFADSLSVSTSVKRVLNDHELYSLFSIIANDRIREDESIEAFYGEVCELYGISSIKINSQCSKQKLFLRLLRMLASTHLLDLANFNVLMNIINGHSAEYSLNCYEVIWLLYKNGLLTQERFNKVANLSTAQLVGCKNGIRDLCKLRQLYYVDVSDLGRISFERMAFAENAVIYGPMFLTLSPIVLIMSPVLGLGLLTGVVAMLVSCALILFATIGVFGMVRLAMTKNREKLHPLDRVTDSILNCENSKEYMSAYIILKNRSPGNLMLLSKSPSPYGMARFINLLKKTNQLNPVNYAKLSDSISRNINLTNLFYFLQLVFAHELNARFSQKLFDELMTFGEILSDSLIQNVLMQIPKGVLGFHDLRACINLCRLDAENSTREQSQKTVDGLVKRLEGLANLYALIIQPQGPQSIHDESVELAVAKSALKLQYLYRNKIDVSINNLKQLRAEITQAIHKWAVRMAIKHDDPQVIDAIAALNRLLNPSHTYTNGKCNISTHELIGYLWCAVNDESRYVTPDIKFDDALAFFVLGLVETQHGNDDNNVISKEACAPGAFNFLMLPAKNYSNVVELNVVTRDMVLNALRTNIAQQLEKHLLKMFFESKTGDEKKKLFDDICAELRDENCDSLPIVLWNEIKPAVKQQMLKYKAFFADDKPKTVDEKFDEFIEHGMQFDGAEKILDQVLVNPHAKNRQATTYSRSLSSTHLGLFKHKPTIPAVSAARIKVQSL